MGKGKEKSKGVCRLQHIGQHGDDNRQGESSPQPVITESPTGRIFHLSSYWDPLKKSQHLLMILGLEFAYRHGLRTLSNVTEESSAD